MKNNFYITRTLSVIFFLISLFRIIKIVELYAETSHSFIKFFENIFELLTIPTFIFLAIGILLWNSVNSKDIW